MGPMAIPSPIVPPQTPMARARSPGSRKMSLMIASDVGIVSAAPAPMKARNAMSVDHRSGQGRADRPQCEHSEPDEEEPLAAEPVGQRPSDEQQAGEHHGVGVDDPLELARRGMQVPDERRECDVEDGVVDVDDQRRQTHDGQRQPPVTVPLPRRHRAGWVQQAHRSSSASGRTERPGPKVMTWRRVPDGWVVVRSVVISIPARVETATLLQLIGLARTLGESLAALEPWAEDVVSTA